MSKRKEHTFRGLSLFASAGIADFGFENTNIDIIIASELLKNRMDVHSFWHPEVITICGDITKKETKDEIIKKSKEKGIDFIFATPPCQGVSLIGKNKSNEQMLADDRNYLIFHAFEIFNALDPTAILIENVARYFKIKFFIEGKYYSLEEVIREKYGDKYNLDFHVFNAADHGVAQNRQRAIIRMWKDGYKWENPEIQETITLEEAIGHLPSLESGEKSNLKNHYARKHTDAHIRYMKNTPTGKSAFENEVHYPKNEKTGKRLKGYSSTYKRMDWDKPAPTITMRNDAISSQSNVHPGRKLADGTYSDARVLTIRELFILSSIDPDLEVPTFTSDIQLRHMIGEAVPPKLIHEIVKGLKKHE